MERQSRNNSLIEFIINLLLYISAGSIGYWILKRWFFKGRSPTQPSRKPPPVGENQKSFIDDVFESPFLEEEEEFRLKPVSVNTYVYVHPTQVNEDGIFCKLLIENTSELSSEEQ